MEFDLEKEIIIGTNEEFLLGYRLLTNQDGSITLTPSFSNHAHIGRVKQVAICKQFLVSGSTDEFIKIFNLHNRREVGSILSQEGTINCLQFHESGFLFSGSEDGTIGIFKMGKWKLVKDLKGHSGSVTGLAVHPSGKLAISISKDKRVITWDLMKGKKAHTAGLKKAGEIIMWSPDGTHYLIATENILNIYSIAHGNIVHTIDFKENIYCFCYVTNKLLVVGGESKNIFLYDLESKTEVLQWEAHETRTKCIITVDESSEECRNIASTSSDGFIKIWKINLSDVTSTPNLLAKINTNSRIICMALKFNSSTTLPLKGLESKANARTKFQRKRKRENNEDHSLTQSEKKNNLPNNDEVSVSDIQNLEEGKLKSKKRKGNKKRKIVKEVTKSENDLSDRDLGNNKVFKKKSIIKKSSENKDIKKVHFKSRGKKKLNGKSIE